MGFLATSFATDRLSRGLGVRGSLLGSEQRSQMLMAYATLEERPDVVIVGSSRIAGGPHASLVEGALENIVGIEASVYELGMPGLRVEFLRHMMATSLEDVPPRELLMLAVEARFFATGKSVKRKGKQAEDIQGEWENKLPHPVVEDVFGGMRDIYGIELMLQEETQVAIEKRQANGGEMGTYMDRVDREKRLQAKRKRLSAAQGHDEIPDHFADGSIQWEWPGEDSETMAAWREVLDRCEDLDCDVVFIRTPLAPGFDQDSMPDVYPLFERDVVEAVRARGFEFHDLQGPGWNDDPSWFYSTTHLANPAVRPFSKRLAEEIIGPYLLDGPAE